MRFWLIAAVAFAAVLITASLGRWQLSRAAEKEDLQSTIDARGRLPPIEGQSLVAAVATPPGDPSLLPGSDPAFALLHRSVVLEGRWLPDHTVYLDNRQMLGRPGFFVITPMALTRGGVVLVQRGWAPRNFQDRQQLPQIQTAHGEVRIEGRVAHAPSRLFEFSGGDQVSGSSRIRQNLDLAAFRAETGLALSPLTVLQTAAPSEGLQRDWPVIGSGVEKHYGYAFQWFGLCGLIALLYVWFQIVRRFIRPRSQPAA